MGRREGVNSTVVLERVCSSIPQTTPTSLLTLALALGSASLPPPSRSLRPNTKKKIAGKKALAIAQAGSDYDPALYASKVDAAIASAKGNTMVFSWSGCPFCKKAKALLDSKGAEYSVLELDQMDDGQKYRAALAERTGRTSMPSIFIGGEGGFIGGFGDGSPGLKPLNDSGELDGKLKAAGAL